MSHLSFHLKCQGHLQIQIPCSFKARAKMQKRQKYVLICVMECYGLWSVLTQSVQILRSDFVQLCNTHFEALKLKRKAKDPHRKFGGIMYRWSKQPYTFRMWNEKHQRNSTNLTLRNHFKWSHRLPTSVSSVNSISWVATFFLPKGHIKLWVVVQNRANFASNFA